MSEKTTTIWINNHSVEIEPNSSYEEAVDLLEDTIMEELESSFAGELILRLFYFFDSGPKPLSPIEFLDFWDGLDAFETLPFLFFSENQLCTTKG